MPGKSVGALTSACADGVGFAQGLAGDYAASGTPPGVCVGGGLAGLNDGRGLPDGLPVDEVASELLGHSSTRVTEGIYAHVTQRLVDEAASALERGLSR